MSFPRKLYPVTIFADDNNNRFALDPSLSLPRIAAQLPFTYTGADLYALCSDAMLHAITRQANAVDAKVRTVNAERADQGRPGISTAHFFDHFATAADTAVLVTEDDFLAAKRELVPSVSVDELGHYERVRKTFEGQGKKEDAPAPGRAAPAAVGTPPTMMTTTNTAGANGKGRKARGKSKGKGKGRLADGGGGGGGGAVEEEEGVEGEEDEDEVDEDEDEYVIRTDHLMETNGKGKGKSAAADDGADQANGAEFGEGAVGDEDMYV